MKKLLFIFAISFNCYSQTKIEVFDAEGKMIAGDEGMSVTASSLDKKMKRRNIFIMNPAYNIVITDMKPQRDAEKAERVAEKEEIKRLRTAIKSISDIETRKALLMLFKKVYR